MTADLHTKPQRLALCSPWQHWQAKRFTAYSGILAANGGWSSCGLASIWAM